MVAAAVEKMDEKGRIRTFSSGVKNHTLSMSRTETAEKGNVLDVASPPSLQMFLSIGPEHVAFMPGDT